MILFFIFYFFQEHPNLSESHRFGEASSINEFIQMEKVIFDPEIRKKIAYVVGVKAFQRNDYRTGISYFKKGLSLSGKEDSLLFLEPILFGLIKQDRSIEKYLNLLSEGKENSLFRSLYLLSNGETERAFELLKPYQDAGPEHKYLYLFLGNLIDHREKETSSNFFPYSELSPYITYLSAYYAFRIGSLERADSLLFSFLETFPSFSLLDDAIYLYSVVLRKKGNIEKSHRNLLFLIENIPESPYIDLSRFYAAQDFINWKEYKKAFSFLEHLVKSNTPLKKVSLEKYIWVGIRLKDFSTVFDGLNALQRENTPVFQRLLIDAIKSAYNFGLDKWCIELVETFNPLDKSEIFSEYIISLLNLGDKEYALKVIQKEDSQKLRMMGYISFGKYYENKKLYKDAYNYYNRAYRISEGKGSLAEKAFLAREMMAMHLGWYRDITHIYRRFLHTFRDSKRVSEIKFNLVKVYISRNQYEKAFPYLKELQKSSYREWALKNIAIMFAKRKDDKAIDSLYALYKEDPEVADWLTAFTGRFYLSQEDPYRAIEILNYALNFPEEMEYKRVAIFYLAEAFYRTDRIQEARELFMNVPPKQDTISFQVLVKLSEIYWKSKEINKIDSLITENIEEWQGKQKAYLYYQWGLIKKEQGERELAKKFFLNSADLYTDNPDSTSLSLYQAALLSQSKEEKISFLERALNLTKNPRMKIKIKQALIDTRGF